VAVADSCDGPADDCVGRDVEDAVRPCVAPERQTPRVDGDETARRELCAVAVDHDVADLNVARGCRLNNDMVALEEQRVHAQTVEHHVESLTVDELELAGDVERSLLLHSPLNTRVARSPNGTTRGGS